MRFFVIRAQHPEPCARLFVLDIGKVLLVPDSIVLSFAQKVEAHQNGLEGEPRPLERRGYQDDLEAVTVQGASRPNGVKAQRRGQTGFYQNRVRCSAQPE